MSKDVLDELLSEKPVKPLDANESVTGSVLGELLAMPLAGESVSTPVKPRVDLSLTPTPIQAMGVPFQHAQVESPEVMAARGDVQTLGDVVSAARTPGARLLPPDVLGRGVATGVNWSLAAAFNRIIEKPVKGLTATVLDYFGRVGVSQSFPLAGMVAGAMGKTLPSKDILPPKVRDWMNRAKAVMTTPTRWAVYDDAHTQAAIEEAAKISPVAEAAVKMVDVGVSLAAFMVQMKLGEAGMAELAAKSRAIAIPSARGATAIPLEPVVPPEVHIGQSLSLAAAIAYVQTPGTPEEKWNAAVGTAAFIGAGNLAAMAPFSKFGVKTLATGINLLLTAPEIKDAVAQGRYVDIPGLLVPAIGFGLMQGSNPQLRNNYLFAREIQKQMPGTSFKQALEFTKATEQSWIDLARGKTLEPIGLTPQATKPVARQPGAAAGISDAMAARQVALKAKAEAAKAAEEAKPSNPRAVEPVAVGEVTPETQRKAAKMEAAGAVSDENVDALLLAMDKANPLPEALGEGRGRVDRELAVVRGWNEGYNQGKRGDGLIEYINRALADAGFETDAIDLPTQMRGEPSAEGTVAGAAKEGREFVEKNPLYRVFTDPRFRELAAKRRSMGVMVNPELPAPEQRVAKQLALPKGEGKRVDVLSPQELIDRAKVYLKTSTGNWGKGTQQLFKSLIARAEKTQATDDLQRLADYLNAQISDTRPAPKGTLQLPSPRPGPEPTLADHLDPATVEALRRAAEPAPAETPAAPAQEPPAKSGSANMEVRQSQGWVLGSAKYASTEPHHVRSEGGSWTYEQMYHHATEEMLTRAIEGDGKPVKDVAVQYNPKTNEYGLMRSDGGVTQIVPIPEYRVVEFTGEKLGGDEVLTDYQATVGLADYRDIQPPAQTGAFQQASDYYDGQIAVASRQTEAQGLATIMRAEKEVERRWGSGVLRKLDAYRQVSGMSEKHRTDISRLKDKEQIVADAHEVAAALGKQDELERSLQFVNMDRGNPLGAGRRQPPAKAEGEPGQGAGPTGKPVPAEVLADYSDLAAKYAKPAEVTGGGEAAKVDLVVIAKRDGLNVSTLSSLVNAKSTKQFNTVLAKAIPSPELEAKYRAAVAEAKGMGELGGATELHAGLPPPRWMLDAAKDWFSEFGDGGWNHYYATMVQMGGADNKARDAWQQAGGKIMEKPVGGEKPGIPEMDILGRAFAEGVQSPGTVIERALGQRIHKQLNSILDAATYGQVEGYLQELLRKAKLTPEEVATTSKGLHDAIERDMREIVRAMLHEKMLVEKKGEAHNTLSPFPSGRIAFSQLESKTGLPFSRVFEEIGDVCVKTANRILADVDATLERHGIRPGRDLLNPKQSESVADWLFAEDKAIADELWTTTIKNDPVARKFAEAGQEILQGGSALEIRHVRYLKWDAADQKYRPQIAKLEIAEQAHAAYQMADKLTTEIARLEGGGAREKGKPTAEALRKRLVTLEGKIAERRGRIWVKVKALDDLIREDAPPDAPQESLIEFRHILRMQGVAAAREWLKTQPYGTRAKYFMSDNPANPDFIDRAMDIHVSEEIESRPHIVGAERPGAPGTETREGQPRRKRTQSVMGDIARHYLKAGIAAATWPHIDEMKPMVKQARLDKASADQLNLHLRNMEGRYVDPGMHPRLERLARGSMHKFWQFYFLDPVRWSWWFARNAVQIGFGGPAQFTPNQVLRAAKVMADAAIGRAPFDPMLKEALGEYPVTVSQRRQLARHYRSEEKQGEIREWRNQLEVAADGINGLASYGDDGPRILTFILTHEAARTALTDYKAGKISYEKMADQLKLDALPAAEAIRLKMWVAKGDVASFAKQLARWRTDLVNYRYETGHRAGVEQQLAGRAIIGLYTFPRATYELLHYSALRPMILGMRYKSPALFWQGLSGLGGFVFGSLTMAATLKSITGRSDYDWQTLFLYSPLSPGVAKLIGLCKDAVDTMRQSERDGWSVTKTADELVNKWSGDLEIMIPMAGSIVGYYEAATNTRGVRIWSLAKYKMGKLFQQQWGKPFTRANRTHYQNAMHALFGGYEKAPKTKAVGTISEPDFSQQQ